MVEKVEAISSSSIGGLALIGGVAMLCGAGAAWGLGGFVFATGLFLMMIVTTASIERAIKDR